MELATVGPDDIEWVARAVGSWDCSTRWSLRGLAPSPPVLHQLLWHQVHLQRAIRKDDGTPAGLLQLVELDLFSGIGRLGLLLDGACKAKLAGGIESFLRLSFRSFPLRKVCVAAPCDVLDVPGYFGPSIRCVGTFREHERRGDGGYADVGIYEIWRESVEPAG